jgi:NAD(P)-dependent dehydrogenase (short-subunit alcohol dehydrogenase family)/acyl carrier protein
VDVPGLSVRHSDLDPAATGRAVLDRCVDELFRTPGAGSVALRRGRRWRRDFQPVPVPSPADPVAGLRERGVYLITGGLGGLGLAVAEDLARRVKARLVLVGRTGLPPREEWDDVLRRGGGTDRAGRAVTAVRRIESAGGEVLVLAADVTDAGALGRVRAETLDRYGRVDGILHAAGTPGGGLAEVRDEATARQVLAPKLAGTLALARVFGADDLDVVVLFSSVIAVVGVVGQVDYCAANAFLDAVARSGHGFGCRVLSVDWGAWLEVGMAAEAGAGDQPVDHPLLRTRRADGSLSGVLTPGTQWLLGEHLVGGVPVLPGTGHLELMHCAVRELTVPPGRNQVVELRDVTFLRPFAVPGPAGADVRVTVTPGPDGWTVLVAGADGGYAQATAGWVDPGPAPRHDLDAVWARGAPPTPPEPPAEGEDLVFLGPHFPVPQDVRVGPAGHPAEHVARLALTDPAPGNWWLQPALLDRAVTPVQLQGGGWLPFGYGRVLARGPLPDRVRSQVRHTGAGPDLVTVDVTVTDEDGVELVAVTDLLLRRTTVLPGTAPGPVTHPPVETGSGAVGIRPADGAEALCRLLAVDLGPQVVVLAEPLAELQARVEAATAAPEELVGPADPDAAAEPRAVDGDYVSPRTELETVLAGIWSDVLGIGEVGVTDDFFELGGNSLVGLRLVAAVRKAVGTKLPMRALFDQPTVAEIAARIEELRDPGAAAPPPEQPIPRLPR